MLAYIEREKERYFFQLIGQIFKVSVRQMIKKHFIEETNQYLLIESNNFLFDL